MSVNPVAKFDKYVLGINVQLAKVNVGFLETYDSELLTEEEEVFERGYTLALLRAATLPRNATIVKAVRTIQGENRSTIRVMPNPIVGKFPLPAELAFAANQTLSLGDNANGTTMEKAPDEVGDAELECSDPNDAPLFRIEADGAQNLFRHFNAIPDGYLEDGDLLGLDPAFQWYTEGGVNYTPGTIPDVEKNLWVNYRNLFDFLVEKFKLARKHKVVTGETPDPAAVYDLCSIKKVYFERVSNRKCGQQLFPYRGKARIAS